MYITKNKPNGTFYDCENLLGLRTCFSFQSSTDLVYVNGLYQNRVFVPVIDRESISLIVSNSAKEFILCGEDFIFSLYWKIFDWHKLWKRAFRIFFYCVIKSIIPTCEKDKSKSQWIRARFTPCFFFFIITQMFGRLSIYHVINLPILAFFLTRHINFLKRKNQVLIVTFSKFKVYYKPTI